MYFSCAVAKQKMCIQEDTSADETAVIFILARMEITAVLYFFSHHRVRLESKIPNTLAVWFDGRKG